MDDFIHLLDVSSCFHCFLVDVIFFLLLCFFQSLVVILSFVDFLCFGIIVSVIIILLVSLCSFLCYSLCSSFSCVVISML